MDVQTTAAEVQATAMDVQSTSSPSSTTANEGDLGKVRDLVLKAHPDIVPDLVRGGSVDELIASVEPARTAYQRIADQLRSREGEQLRSREERDDSSTSRLLPAATISSTPSVVQPPVVPAGGASNVADPGEIKPMSKIATAIAERRRGS